MKINNIDEFDWDENNDILLNKKVNFIYANNGVGKTVITNKLVNDINSEFIQLKNNNENIYFDASSFTMKPNIKKINLYKDDINKCLKSIEENIIKKLKEKDIFKSKNVWTKYFSLYLNDANINLISDILEKKYSLNVTNENFEENKRELENFINYVSKIDDNQQINLEIAKYQNNLNYKDIKKNYEFISNKIKDNENQLKNEINTILEEYKNLDLNILNKVYELIKNLKQMDECYICNSKIDDFNKVKESINSKIQEYKNKIINSYDISDYIKYFSDLGILDKELFFDDPKKYIEELLNKINSISDYFKWILKDINKCILDDYKKFINNLDMLIKEEENSIYKLNNINNSHFEIMESMVHNIIGEDRIKFNFKNTKNFISIDGENEFHDSLPLSSGEKSLLNFIFNLFLVIAEFQANNKKKYVIIDDPNDFFDNKNYLNMYYLIKMASYEYDIIFLILTHNDHIITSFFNSRVDLNLQIMYINNNDCRIIENVKSDEIKFLSFSNGVQEIVKEIKKENNVNDKSIFIIYFMWILRVKEYIFESSDESYKNKIFQFTKYPFLLNNENTDLFDDIKKILNKEFNIDININIGQFLDITKSLSSDHNNIKFTSNNNLFVMRNNVLNMVKIIFLREKIREFCVNKLKNNKESNDDNWRKKIVLLNEQGLVNEEFKIKSIYLLNILDGYIHIENKPSLLVNGISLDQRYLDNLYKIWNSISGDENEK